MGSDHEPSIVFQRPSFPSCTWLLLSDNGTGFLLLGSRTFSNCLDFFFLYLNSTVFVSCIPTTGRESSVGNYTAGLKGLEQKHHTISLTFQVVASISIHPEVTGWIAQPCTHFNLIAFSLNFISIRAPI